MRLFMASAFDAYSGYGWDAIDIALGLEERGHDVVPWPTKIMPGLPPKLAIMLAKKPQGPYDLVLSFQPPFDTKPDELVRYAPKTMAWSMWETSKVMPDDMRRHGFGDYQQREADAGFVDADGICEEEYMGRWFSWSRYASADHKGIDRFLVTCPMNVDAFANVDPNVDYRVLPCGIDPERFPEIDRPTGERRMVFAMCGMLQGRKDPFLMLDAWRELKHERPDFDALLVLKTSAPGLHPDLVSVYPDVQLVDRSWPIEKLIAWYGTVDVMVSVSRGEGNNKPAMEFMSSGGTVIASNWSGHQNWLYPEFTYPLDGVLKPAHGDPEGALDYRVNKEHLKQTLLECWENPHEVKEKGRLAAKFIRSSLSWDVVLDKLEAHMREVAYG